jgi:hypothetical protein
MDGFIERESLRANDVRFLRLLNVFKSMLLLEQELIDSFCILCVYMMIQNQISAWGHFYTSGATLVAPVYQEDSARSSECWKNMPANDWASDVCNLPNAESSGTLKQTNNKRINRF